MTGWATPSTPGPVVGWELPSEPEGLGVRESIGAGWRVLRMHFGTLAGTAALPEILRNLMIIPSIAIVARGWEAMIEFFRDLDLRTYDPNDQLAMQQRLQQAFQPPADLAILSGVASGVSITVGLISLSLVTAATLAAIDGRRPSVAGSYRAVKAHAGSLIVPAIILGAIWLLVSVPAILSQGLLVPGDATALRTQAAVAAVVGLLSLVVTVAAIVLAVRWSLVIPAILAEDLTFRRGLSRSAELTAGIRVRIFVILLVLGIMLGFVLGLVAGIAAIAVGIATFSLVGGIAGYLVVTTIGGLIAVPWVAAILSHIYRLQARSAATTDRPDEPVGSDGPEVAEPAPSA